MHVTSELFSYISLNIFILTRYFWTGTVRVECVIDNVDFRYYLLYRFNYFGKLLANNCAIVVMATNAYQIAQLDRFNLSLPANAQKYIAHHFWGTFSHYVTNTSPSCMVTKICVSSQYDWIIKELAHDSNILWQNTNFVTTQDLWV